MRVGDIECLIQVKGEMALNEYGLQRSADGRTCMAWIPSRIDQEFSIVYHDPKLMRVTGSYPRIDGALYKGHMLKKGENLCVQKYVRTGPQELRRLKFGALRLTADDDDTYPGLLCGQRDFGEISVDIWRCDIRPECKKVPNSYTVPSPTLAHERSKKAVTHAVTFGAPILYPASRNQHIVRVGTHPNHNMQLGNLSCWISVNGARLEEYGIEEDDEQKERIAWIASELDQSFCVNWRDPDGTRATASKLLVDGIFCGSTVIEFPRRLGDEVHQSRAYTSATEARPLQFGRLDLTVLDDDTYLNKDAKDVGQIEVHLWRVRVKSKTEYKGIELAEHTQVHEKTKKGLQLAVKFGAKETVPHMDGLTCGYIERLASFIFRYRTIGALSPPVASSANNASAASSSSSPPVAGRKRRASEALTPEPQDVKSEIKQEIDLVALDEAEERVRQIEEQYRRAKQELEQRRRNKKVKIEEITSFISGEPPRPPATSTSRSSFLGMKIDRLDCCIRVDNEPLPEYDVKLSEDEETCTAWIPCKAGQEFYIVCADPHKRVRATCSLDVKVEIDGVESGLHIIEKNRKSNKIYIRDVLVSSTESRKFQFGALDLTDDDAYLYTNERKIGEIVVKFWRSRINGSGGEMDADATIQDPTPVHETEKKGYLHVVRLGKVGNISAQSGITAKKLDDEPLAVFTFYYRGIDMLRANGLAPTPESQQTQPQSQSRSPTPGPSGSGSRGEKRSSSRTLSREPEDVKPDIVDLEELEDVEARVRKAEEALRRARFEVQQRKGNKRIKIEDVPAFVSGETIDLTEN
ncbi:hypothetical protein EV715DRAFT_212063 [Schizophyllum commune]